MNPLKKLIKLQPQHPNNSNEENKELNGNSENKKTYHQTGYNDAKDAMGSARVFDSCLEAVYESFKEKCRHDDNEQLRLNGPYIQEKERQNTELNKREVAKSIKSEHIEEDN